MFPQRTTPRNFGNFDYDTHQIENFSTSNQDQSYDGDTESCCSSTHSLYPSLRNTASVMSNGRKEYFKTLKSKNLGKAKPPSKPELFRYPKDAVFLSLNSEIYKTQKNYPPPIPKRPMDENSLITACGSNDLFPEERCKTLLGFLLALFSFILTLTSLVLTHERLPKREYAPLPDVVLDNLEPFDWALDLSEYIILVSTNTTIVILLFHRHRFIVFRRLFLIVAVLYFYRAITMYITVLPIASKSYHCDPKSGHLTFMELIIRVLKLMSGLGLSMNGKHVYCGDFIYSGHTVTLILTYLLVAEYTSERFWLLHCVYWFLAGLGIVFLEFAHGHYSIDVVVAYYITTRVFWTYHTLANNMELKEKTERNYYSREWWFRIFQYFERNVGGQVPNEYYCSYWWPEKWYVTPKY